jgi:dihydrofolate synthase/folylpolyglutamate synthase
VVGALPDEALLVVTARAREQGAPLCVFSRDFGAELRDAGTFGVSARLWDGPLELEVALPLLGEHQAHNAALALACARRAAGLSDAELAAAARRGFAEVVLPGRLELLQRSPAVLVDGAHTAASARALSRVLAQLRRGRVHLVLSISAGKDLDAILAALLPHCDALTATRAEPTRSLAPAEVAAAVRALAPGLSLRVVPNPQLALRAAHAELAPEDCLCAAGSVYLAGIARRVLARPRPAADVAVTRGRGPLLA